MEPWKSHGREETEIEHYGMSKHCLECSNCTLKADNKEHDEWQKQHENDWVKSCGVDR